MRLGRKRPHPLAKKLRLHNYIGTPSGISPSSVDYSPKAIQSLRNVYDNDRLGDCVIAGGYHVLGVTSGNAQTPFIASEAQILADYKAIGGYDPNIPNSDNGCDEITALNYWANTGFADGSKLQAWTQVSGDCQTCIRESIFLFENLYLGIELPDAWIQPFPSADGFVWAGNVGPTNPSNGHCVMAYGYNEVGVQICTWGLLGTITWQALAQYTTASSGGECYTMLTPDECAQQKAPNGYDYASLIADFQQVKSNG